MSFISTRLFMFVVILLILIYSTESESTPQNLPEVLESSQENDAHQKQLNVLILTFPVPGHTVVPLALGEELVRRGHSVTFSTVGNKTQSQAEKQGMKFIDANQTGSAVDVLQFAQMKHSQKSQDSGYIFLSQLKEFYSFHLDFYSLMVQQGEMLIGVFKAEIEAGQKYDMIIGDDFLLMVLPCMSDYTNTPAMVVGTTTQNYPHTYPPWPWASSILGIDTEDLSFSQRLAHQLERIILPFLINYLLEAPISTSIESLCPNLPVNQRRTSPAIYFPNILPTIIGFEYSRTLTPLTHYVGPILSKNPPELSNDLRQWLDGKPDNSVIFISMGSLASITETMANTFITGIGNTNYSVIWALRKNGNFELSLDPERYYVSKWLPQVAILKHRAVAIAILHCGANGLHESLYYGVPAICLPGMSEQRANAARMVNQNLGVKINKAKLTAELVYESIKELESGNYQENALKLSRMFKAAGGADRAAELVEYYSEVGYSHLVPAYAKYNWSWVQFYNFDVYLLLLAILLATGYFWYRFLRCVCISCCCRPKKVKSD